VRKGTSGRVQVHVNVDAETLHDMISDVMRMGEWSPETVHCVWLLGVTAATPGATFKGTNRRGVSRWSTKAEVVVADRGREFSPVTHFAGPSTEMDVQPSASIGRWNGPGRVV